MTPESTREAALREADPWIQLLADWEDKNGTIAGITPPEYEDLMDRVRKMAVRYSPRMARNAALAPAVEAGEADTSDNVCPDCRAKFGKHVDGCVYEPNPSPSAIRLAQEEMRERCARVFDRAAEERAIGSPDRSLCRTLAAAIRSLPTQPVAQEDS